MTKVLVVDDKEENNYYLQALLTGHDCEVSTARHGAEALVKARQSPPDLVVSDLLMPVMDGYTLLRHWKADDRLKNIPFIVYTATYTEAEDERLAISLGADAFILKPAEPEAFLARLREVQLNRAAAIPAPPKQPMGDEKQHLKYYSETLIRKLEEKTLQLETANKVLSQDLTERKNMEETLRESEERFRVTFEQAAVGIAHVGPDGRFLRVNDKLCSITGYSREELLQKTFVELTLPEDQAEGDAARRAMLAGTQSGYTAEKRYQRKDGQPIWCSVVTSLLRDPASAPRYFITVITDISERRALQDRFLRAQRMESIGRLAGGIAHDLNNLLAPILMGVELLKLRTNDEKLHQLIDTVGQSASRGKELVQQVLALGDGMEAGKIPVQLRSLVRELQVIISTTFPKNIVFEYQVPAECWMISGDATQLGQVLLNLSMNARDAMPSGGTIALRAENRLIDALFAGTHREIAPGNYLMIEVKDTGVGMSTELRNRIFEPLFTTKADGKNSGLGLPVSQGIVHAHGGCMEVWSEAGQGSTFRIYLPALAKLQAAAGDSAHPFGDLPRGLGELILVVDDEASILQIMRQTLDAFGYRVVIAEDGAQAIAIFAAHREEVALVVTDMVMPVMDGAALIAALRRLQPEIRIVAVSGISAAVGAAQLKALKIEHFIAKPFTTPRLLEMVQKVLAQKQTGG